MHCRETRENGNTSSFLTGRYRISVHLLAHALMHSTDTADLRPLLRKVNINSAPGMELDINPAHPQPFKLHGNGEADEFMHTYRVEWTCAKK